MTPTLLLAGYCILIVFASLAGGWIPMRVRLTHRRMELALSFVSGVMLGVALLHLLPHAWAEEVAARGGGVGGSSTVTAWLLGGFLVTFFLERFFCFHHHDVPETDEDDGSGHACAVHHGHTLAWSGAAIGLTVHSVIAGVALAASVRVEGAAGALAGLGTFLVIALHKPFDALTIGTLMAARGSSRRSRHVINTLFCLAIPAGAVLFWLGADDAGAHRVTSAALAVSAGTFLCIALSDLLPELQFHQHDRVKLSAALLLGLAIAWGSARLEAMGPGHDHDHDPAAEAEHEHATGAGAGAAGDVRRLSARGRELLDPTTRRTILTQS